MHTNTTQQQTTSGFQADFKASADKREIRFASKEEVEKQIPIVNEQFAVAFDILAKN